MLKEDMVNKLMEKLTMARMPRDESLVERGRGAPMFNENKAYLDIDERILGEKHSRQEMDRRREAECHRGFLGQRLEENEGDTNPDAERKEEI